MNCVGTYYVVGLLLISTCRRKILRSDFIRDDAWSRTRSTLNSGDDANSLGQTIINIRVIIFYFHSHDRQAGSINVRACSRTFTIFKTIKIGVLPNSVRKAFGVCHFA